jgi:hypothetical protein
MSLDHEIIRRRMRRNDSLGKMLGLLVACFATVLGVYHGHEPFVVLSRAVISGIVVAAILSFGTGVVHLANIENPTTKKQKR